MPATRHLVLVLGDQLDHASAALDGFDPEQDRVWMVEIAQESTHVWSHKVRIAMFLAAMRHFWAELDERGIQVHYRRLEDTPPGVSFDAELRSAIERYRPGRIIVVEPGEYRVAECLRRTAEELGVPYEVRPDRHFFCSTDEFRRYVKGKPSLVMEFFYRDQRRKHRILMDGTEPAGGQWNYDALNRASFGKKGPQKLPPTHRFPPDATTREVITVVERTFPEHPGRLATFDFPVTHAQALMALDDFINTRLPTFGRYQDAMWQNEPYLYHSRLSAAMNLKLLDPHRVVAAAERAYRTGAAPLASVEGFIRQILGWREYVRGVYWTYMPEYATRNALDAHEPLPHFYWTGGTDMNCLKHALGQTLEYGYAHHIQRLMVTGLYSLLLGVDAQKIHEWYLAIYVDAVEWVELPNVIGMSQFADGGLMGSKPYVASGRYIQRMSNYCSGCRYRPEQSTGEGACPFTTLYWDFLMRHGESLEANERMRYQMMNVARLDAPNKLAIQQRAEAIRRAGGQAPEASR